MKKITIFVLFLLLLNSLNSQNTNVFCGYSSIIRADPRDKASQKSTFEVLTLVPGAKNVIYIAFQLIPDRIILSINGRILYKGEIGDDCSHGLTSQCMRGPVHIYLPRNGNPAISDFVLPSPFMFSPDQGYLSGGVAKFTIETPLKECTLTIEILPNNLYQTVMWIFKPCVERSQIFDGIPRDTVLCYGSKFQGKIFTQNDSIFELPESDCRNPVLWRVKVLGEKIQIDTIRMCDSAKITVNDNAKYIKNILWDFGSKKLSVVIPMSKDKTLFVTDTFGCVQRYVFNIKKDSDFTVFLLRDTVIALHVKELTLPIISSLYDVTWFETEGGTYNHSHTKFIFFDERKQYKIPVLLASKDGCKKIIHFTVSRIGEQQVYVPNAFSPNADGVNDIFSVYVIDQVIYIKRFLIFDRFGELLFKKEDFNPHDFAGWDGTFRSVGCENGVYVWMLQYQNVLDKKIYTISGDVTLLR